MAVEEEKAGEAMAPIQESRRTLRDAGARQHVVKMSRQFFQHDSSNRRWSRGWWSLEAIDSQ